MNAAAIPPAPFRFRLYVAGETPNSAQALANLTAICQARLPGRHQIEVVDVLRHPERALADSIFMTPTLVKLGPPPPRRIVGTLSNESIVLAAMGLTHAA